jgi:hypothetical protein
MSMDLEVWSAEAFELPSWLPLEEQWVRYGDQWALERDEWQVLVSYSGQPSDAPPDVRARLPGASHHATVTLEPIDAEEPGYVLLGAVTRGLAQCSNGVWLDPSGRVLQATEL